jgi:hypothetical protein
MTSVVKLALSVVNEWQLLRPYTEEQNALLSTLAGGYKANDEHVHLQHKQTNDLCVGNRALV